ncbi:MAG: hypothetical protein DME97_02030 [Verrucomicrobia bacterium]|nr:MAG: hypothetical protein DME97_02030 [Verrucomicrobiota bacterium]
MSERAYRLAVLFAIAFAFAHLISLPIGITYDGFQYLDGADVLGSSRFPADWYRNRTPLYPLALKASFVFFGQQPLAAMFVSTVMGLGATLLFGRVARSLAGAWGGAAVVIVISLFPTGVAYQHLILTETGTSFFIALLIAVALQKPKTERAAWTQALLFGGVLATGYYWRQLLLNLAPVAAALWFMRNWAFVREGGLFRPRGLGRMALAPLLILVAPLVISHLWDPFTDRAGLAEITMRQGIIRQALLAPSDPVVGENKAAYISAVRESVSEGNFFSGIRNDLFDPLFDRLFRDRPMGTGDTKRVFMSGILHYPSRYLGGVARTALLFIGAKATVNENRIFRTQILSPTWPGAKIGDGPPNVQDHIKQQFQQFTTSSAVLQLLWHLCPLYDFLLLIANVVAIMAFPYALLTRNYEGMALAAFPMVYLGLYAVILASIDRFAMPAYPATLAILIIFPVLISQRFRSRRAVPQGEPNAIAVAAARNQS